MHTGAQSAHTLSVLSSQFIIRIPAIHNSVLAIIAELGGTFQVLRPSAYHSANAYLLVYLPHLTDRWFDHRCIFRVINCVSASRRIHIKHILF
jgi:hypothetical protein